MRTRLKYIYLVFLAAIFLAKYSFSQPGNKAVDVTSRSVDSIKSNLKFINNGFGNASPFNWEVDSNGSIVINLVYDHERSSPNRANQHWHFQVQANPGSNINLVLRNFDNIWNGHKAFPISDSTPCFISDDGKNWRAIRTRMLSDYSLNIQLHMETDQLYVASLEPYRISDLERLLSEIRNNPLVQIDTIGKTSEGRSLEMIRVGNENARHRIFLRARAHGFETGN